jgi:hypothetical protein
MINAFSQNILPGFCCLLKNYLNAVKINPHSDIEAKTRQKAC